MSRQAENGGQRLAPLPKGWRATRVKRICSMHSGDHIAGDEICEEGEFPVYGGNDLRGYYPKYNCEGPMLIVGRQGALCGNVHRINGKFWATEHALITTLTHFDNLDYLYYLFTDLNFNQYVSQSAAQPGLAASKILQVETVLPPRPEQERIAAFLDEKCATVDKAIEVKRKQLKNVGEFWANVLQEMTVRGVCKSRLVQTGNVFIPEIPEGWKLAKTLHCLDMPITDGPHTTPELWDEGVPFVSAEAVSNGNGKIDFARIRGFISEEFYEECCKKYIPRRDDVYMVKSGATTGRVAIVDTDTRFTIWSPLAVFRAREYCILPRYLFYTIQAQYYQEQVERNWTFGTQQNIGMRALERLKIILPPLVTQEEIVNVLDERRTHLDDVASNLRKQIETLEQYRKSLIHEYVTGARRVV